MNRTKALKTTLRKMIQLPKVVPVFLFVLFLCPLVQSQVLTEQTVSPRGFFLAFCCLVIGGITTNAYLVGLVRPDGAQSRWHRSWEFTPDNLGGFSWQGLALWSLLSLFMELLMIRWVSSEIPVFAYFKNFVLIACFLGFGLGCYLSRRKINLLLMLVPLIVLTILVQLPWSALRAAIKQLPSFIAASNSLQIWEAPSGLVLPAMVVATAVIVPIFGLIAFFFVPMGQLVGWYLENGSNGILAYSANVLAALFGIVLYTALCFFSQPPAIWFLVSGLLLLVLLWKMPHLRWAALVAWVLCMGLLSLRPPGDARVYWSPYQKLTLQRWAAGGQVWGYSLNTNDSWYQHIIDLSPRFVRDHEWLFESSPVQWNAYNIPYHFYQGPGSVLILGSGMGNDVAAALRNGSAQVTAVEIDPIILKLGKQFHPEKPYDSGRVRIINDDARSYLQNSADKFDLIVFSLLDSHTTSSYYTNIRIDNYVYTAEALEAAKRLLTPDGIFIVKFQVQTPWIAGRVYGLLSQVFGRSPLQLQSYSPYTSGGSFFITGSQETIAHALADPDLAKYVEQNRQMAMEQTNLTTDDWPYFYQRSPGLPLPVIVISAVLIFLCVMLLRDMGTPIRSIRGHFFFLGAGFLLLEAQIISKMALLFGTTWLVNSIVISGLLLLILFSNALVALRPRFSTTVAYGGLFVTLAIGFLLPLKAIFFASVSGRIVVSILTLCLPVFFAGIVFIRSFAESGFSANALGSNLLGAMVGGMLESASLWTGIRSLAIVAALLYLASWIALRRKAADSEVGRLAPVGADAR